MRSEWTKPSTYVALIVIGVLMAALSPRMGTGTNFALFGLVLALGGLGGLAYVIARKPGQ